MPTHSHYPLKQRRREFRLTTDTLTPTCLAKTHCPVAGYFALSYRYDVGRLDRIKGCRLERKQTPFSEMPRSRLSRTDSLAT